MNKRIIVYRHVYLPISETFIYQQLIQLKHYKPILITGGTPQNLHHFPFKPIQIIRNPEAISQFVRKNKISLLHARFGSGGIHLLPVKRKTNLPLLTSFHGSDLSKQLKNPKYKSKLKLLLRAGDLFTVVSGDMKRKLMGLGCPEEKIKLLRTGIDLSKFPFQPHEFQAFSPLSMSQEGDKVHLLTVGRLVEKKGIHYLLLAFSKLIKSYPQLTLTIVGDGEMKARLFRLAQKLGLGNQVKWKGALPQDSVIAEMKKCHIFCLPSMTARDGNQEGIPNVLIEAMALGRPVITTSHAGIPELIGHHQTGYLVEEKNVGQLARQIEWVMKELGNQGSLLQRARKKVEEEHDIQKQVEKLERIYDQLVASREG